MQLKGKHVLVLGLGESGLAMARWCGRQGATVRVMDTRQTPPYLVALEEHAPGAEFVCGPMNDGFDKSVLDGIDLVALSPGLSNGMLALIHARAQDIPVVGEIELFAWALDDLGLRGPDANFTRVIAITGTNGKTTTTALTAHLCNAGGLPAKAAGNISPAALTALMDAIDTGTLPKVWVLELSSFQLETLESLAADAATVLNISDDHLDRYIDLDDYAAAKGRIFLASGDRCGAQVLNRDDFRSKRMALADRSVISFGLDAPGNEGDFGLRENRGESWIVRGSCFLLPVSELPINGLHNAANAMAALALCAAIGLDPVKLLPALRAFKGLPHRVEKVAEIAGVTYYDDSKGTNVGATVAALQGMGRPVVVILGGDGKGQDFSPLMAAVATHARAVVLIGRDGPLIGNAIAASGIATRVATDLLDAVAQAAAAAQPGDAVLLSPACASFDMFRNYEHRAQVFIEAVKSLEHTA
ncbi:MAG: UDP-N-acetylmuramoyl-L-alanine--D-glutamate ligase [Rhodocyclaceae bacterium]|nr:UDP-N-acetylmuramoyl-L-alanine--D-glutamate ligase [Rhodocyclaceae bacterium]